MSGFLIFVLTIAALAVILVMMGVKSVPQGAEWTVERFGRLDVLAGGRDVRPRGDGVEDLDPRSRLMAVSGHQPPSPRCASGARR